MFRKKINKDIKSILKGSFTSFIFQIIGIALGYLFIYFISKYYGAKTMGIYALMFSLLNITVLFSKFGLDLSIIKFVGEVSEIKNISFIKDIYFKILSLSIPISLILSIGLFISAKYIADYIFHKPYLKEYIELIAFGVIPMTLRFINANALRGFQEIKKFAFLHNVSLYLFAIIILIIFIFFKNFNVIAPIISLLFGLCISMLLSFYLWFNSSKLLNYSKEFYISFKGILKVSFPLFLTSSIMLVYSMSDVIMLGIFRSDKEVGIYNVDFKIGSAGMIFSMALTSVLAPKIAAAYKEKNFLRLKANTIFVIGLSFVLSLIFYIFIFLYSNILLNFFGKDFLSSLNALKILLVGFFIKSVFGILGYVLEMTHYQKHLLVFSIISSSTNILLNYFLIPSFGITGAVIASVISVIIHHFLLLITVISFFRSDIERKN